MTHPPPLSTLFPYTTLFRSRRPQRDAARHAKRVKSQCQINFRQVAEMIQRPLEATISRRSPRASPSTPKVPREDRKSTRLNSSHLGISYAVFCLKKKKKQILLILLRRARLPRRCNSRFTERSQSPKNLRLRRLEAEGITPDPPDGMCT